MEYLIVTVTEDGGIHKCMCVGEAALTWTWRPRVTSTIRRPNRPTCGQLRPCMCVAGATLTGCEGLSFGSCSILNDE
ncbi:MAG: hypothetical protein FWG65_03720 [Turicibacter sp.]|nr:hypothetical protein [Turicibacter sp.]